MQEPTIESLSAGIQLWHISNEIYADWSQLLRAIEMWSRDGQNVLWFKINGISIKMPMTKNKKKQTTRCSPNLASETWVLMDFERSGGLLICLKLLFRWVYWIPVHQNLMQLISTGCCKYGIRWTSWKNRMTVWLILASDPVIADGLLLHASMQSQISF